MQNHQPKRPWGSLYLVTLLVLWGYLGVHAQIANYGSPYARFGMG